MKRAAIMGMICSLMMVPIVLSQETAIKPSGDQSAKKERADNFPYVVSGLGGFFYVKTVPDGGDETKGMTKVYRVKKDADEALDTYDWYVPNGVSAITLGWSPTVGKVSIMRVHHEPTAVTGERAEISLYIGGKLLKSYTLKDMVALGAKLDTREKGKDESRTALEFKVLGCEQVNGTNDYRFAITVADGKRVLFDIITGDVVKQIETK